MKSRMLFLCGIFVTLTQLGCVHWWISPQVYYGQDPFRYSKKDFFEIRSPHHPEYNESAFIREQND